jgi:hypothetical protein
MSDDTEAFPGKDDAFVPAKRKVGRPPKKRHDPPPAPVDGDYSLDQIINKDSAFDYGLISQRQRGRYQARGWIPERWAAGCARSRWDYGAHKDGDEVLVNNELTLMKIPLERRAAMADAERANHKEALNALKRAAINSGGAFKQFNGVQF